MKRFRLFSIFMMATVLLLTATPLPTASSLSGSEFQAGRIIDDSKFFSGLTMSVSDVQHFLESKVPVCDTWGQQMHSTGQTRAQYAASQGVYPPFTCLKDYQTSIPSKAAESGLCNGIATSGATASEIITMVASSCGINPQVLIVLLQKEQSLITDDWPWPIQYRSATGYGCPDTAACDSEYYGFFNQVYHAARQFKRYARDSHLFNYRAGVNNYIQYNPNASCNGSTVFIQNQATAGLYNYTPYQPNAAALNNLYGTGDSCSAYGNRNFWRLYNDWFGSTFGPPDYSCKYGTNIAGVPTGQHIIGSKLGINNTDNLRLIIPNNTGSKCVEVHTWQNNNYNAWIQHIATNSPSINPNTQRVMSLDGNGDGIDELYKIDYSGTGSGMIEVHVWDGTNQRWLNHVATNRPSISLADAEVVAAKTSATGPDSLFLVQYRNTSSGRVEIHRWSGNLQQWVSHTATNYGVIDPAGGQVVVADFDGGPDEFYLVNYAGSSGRIEVHGWTSNFQQWFSHVATVSPAATHVDGSGKPITDVIAADTNGNGQDELYKIDYSGTGSGRVEIHGWTPGFQQWFSHIPTSQGSF